MGRIGGWFKKSDDKEKATTPAASNPYAQQQPGGQQSGPPQYDQYTQYNNNQYNDNQHISQSSQGPPSGLPAGPRPGGLPSRVAPGPRMGAFESNKGPGGDDKSPPPQYSPYDRGSPSLSSAGGTPVLSSNTQSPSMSTGGFPKEKYGAADGVGRNRFESSAPSPYGNYTPPAPRAQGGYGNLDTGSDALFANYKGPSTPNSGAPSAGEQLYVDRTNMTEEEREQADYDEIRDQIKQEREGTKNSANRALEALYRAHDMADESAASLDRQGQHLDNVKGSLMSTQVQVRAGNLNIKTLNRVQKMSSVFTDTKDRNKFEDEKLLNQMQEKSEREEEQRRVRRAKARADERMRDERHQQDLLSKPDPRQRSKFVLEEEDEEDEAEIEQKQDLLLAGVSGLRQKLVNIGHAVDDQNETLEDLAELTNRAHDGVLESHSRLRRIK